MPYRPNRDAGSVSMHRNPCTRRRDDYNEGHLFRIDDAAMLRRLTRKETTLFMRDRADDIDVMRGYKRPECLDW